MKKNLKNFFEKTQLLESPILPLEEIGKPIKFDWNKCKLETVSFGHGITITPIQATAAYAAIVNGGKIIKPNLVKKKMRKNLKD